MPKSEVPKELQRYYMGLFTSGILVVEPGKPLRLNDDVMALVDKLHETLAAGDQKRKSNLDTLFTEALDAAPKDEDGYPILLWP